MQAIELAGKAKINLSLDVLGKRPDGYHEVKMIMQTIDLCDRIFVDIIDEGIEIECNCPWVPNNSDNIAFKAANLIKEKYAISKGVKIKIEKNIPVAAGLAGGSTDAASVLKGMNILFNLGISTEELMVLGKQIGADVPYCIKGGTMLAEGIGEKLTELPPLCETDILIVKPKIGVSTAWVYKSLNLQAVGLRPDTDIITKAIREKNNRLLCDNMKNVLETVTIPKYTVIKRIKEKLIQSGAIGSMMSGSGPSVFGVFEDRQSAERALGEISKSNWECYLTKSTQ
jgi:4-diphosphocytidyl-2-C-methyl-D-erythritol kinase